MKYEIVKEFPNEILFDTDGPCISIYQPTHRNNAGRQKDKIVFKNQLQKIEKALRKDFKEKEVEDILAPLYELDQDVIFWNHTKDGIAILLNRTSCVIYNINRDLKEFAVVSNSFHIKPLIRVFQSTDKYYVLGINRKNFKLFYGDRYGLREITFNEDVAVKIEDVLGDQYTESYLTNASYGGVGGNTMFHGHGGKKDEIDIDIERYFRYIDRFVLNNFSKPTQAPLILVGLDEHQGWFRKFSHNHWLLEEGIRKDFESLDLDGLTQESWKLVEDIYVERTRILIDRYHTEKAKGLASDSVKLIGKRAVQNRVATILIESDKILPGDIDDQTGEIHKREIEDMREDDILDDLAQIVFTGGGEVVMLPKDKMPTDTGLAAVFRY